MKFLGGKQKFEDVVRSLHVALDELAALELTPSDQKAAIALVCDVESLGTRIDSLQTSLVGVIEESGVHQLDAFTPKSFIGHHARTSKTEAGARHRTMRALRDLPASLRPTRRPRSPPTSLVASLGSTRIPGCGRR